MVRLTFIRTHEPCVLFFISAKFCSVFISNYYRNITPKGCMNRTFYIVFLQLKSFHIARLNLPAACLCYNTIYGVEIVC